MKGKQWDVGSAVLMVAAGIWMASSDRLKIVPLGLIALGLVCLAMTRRAQD